MDAQEEKYIKMTTPPVEKLICRLAVPCIVSMLVTSFYNMADTYFVGMLKSNARLQIRIKRSSPKSRHGRWNCFMRIRKK